MKLRNHDHSGLYYPSTVRTALIPGLHYAWHWVLLYYCQFKYQNQRPDPTWFFPLMEFLHRESRWAGVYETSLTDITFYAFLTPRQGVNPSWLFDVLTWHASDHNLKFAVRHYRKKRGPAYYLRGVRYPCLRCGAIIIDR
jgi:hypothetical protein